MRWSPKGIEGYPTSIPEHIYTHCLLHLPTHPHQIFGCVETLPNMSITIDKILAASPNTERGRPTQLSSDPKGERLAYAVSIPGCPILGVCSNLLMYLPVRQIYLPSIHRRPLNQQAIRGPHHCDDCGSHFPLRVLRGFWGRLRYSKGVGCRGGG